MTMGSGSAGHLKSLAEVDRNHIASKCMEVVMEQLVRSRDGQYVTSMKAISKKVARFFGLRVSGGFTTIIRQTLLHTTHPHLTVEWFDDRHTLLEISRR